MTSLQEKRALMRTLAQSVDQAEAERRGQQEVLRLKREQRKVREEEKFASAALFIGVARQQEKE